MENQIKHHNISFDKPVLSYFLPDVVRSVLHTIFYHRFLGVTQIVTEKCSLLNSSFMKFRGNDTK